MTSITAYKAFEADWTCRGYQYAVGQSYTHDGAVDACSGGFHACERPLDVLAYYPPAGSRFAVVEQSGDLSRRDDDTKVASRHISIKAEISLADLIKLSIDWTFARALPVDPESPASATGDSGAASATGNSGAASATGDSGAASATGNSGAASATGDSGAASATGNSGAASATGNSGAASATGYRGAASATGNSGAASATGDSGAASATGNSGAASATGNSGAASATGNSGAASATGKHCVAMATGFYGHAMATDGNAIVLVNRNDDGSIRHIRAAKVGEHGIKAGVWYSLDDEGQFEEVAA